MKNSKVMLPLMAFICAILMSFTTFEIDGVQAQDFVLLEDGSWRAINEVNCGQGSKTCRVQFGQGGPIYEVYDQMDLSTRRISNSPNPFIISPQ